MTIVPHAKDPAVRTYKALRRAVGWVALLLPFALILPWWLFGNHLLPTSISGYYYTGMRNLFVGCLCAIAMFNFCCQGYDWKDEVAGIVSAACAVGVAFCPTTPDVPVPTPRELHFGFAHLVFASLLFLTLAYMCLALFTITAADRILTRKKQHRNRVYKVCGVVIVISIALIVLFKLLGLDYLVGGLGAMFCFETAALVAFGIAWLVKGDGIPIIRDEPLQGQ